MGARDCPSRGASVARLAQSLVARSAPRSLSGRRAQRWPFAPPLPKSCALLRGHARPNRAPIQGCRLGAVRASVQGRRRGGGRAPYRIEGGAERRLAIARGS
eukprot:9856766-Alexandrium_andersonii.AAC.1